MIFSKNSEFYKKAKTYLDNYVKNGGDVNNITTTDPIYIYIKNQRLTDKQGNIIDLEAKFKLLGHSREIKKTKNLREDLIKDINTYLENGGSFHINRKKFPFYERLRAYVRSLERKGINATQEEIMKFDLGFREFSEIYYRCSGIEQFPEYRDDEGYIDSYRKDREYNNYIKELAKTYDVPYYIVITLLANEKARNYFIDVDKVQYTKRLLENYVAKNKTLVGLKRKDPIAYNAFDYLIRYYSNGNQDVFSKQEWLDVFGLGDVENRFRELKRNEDVEFNSLMTDLINRFGENEFYCKDLSEAEYRRVIKKAVQMNVPVYEIFRMYGLNVRGNNVDRLSSVRIEEIPYIEEMKKRRDEIIAAMKKPKMGKEEVMEIKVKAMKIAYQEYKHMIDSYLPDIQEEAEVTNEI